MAFEIIITPFAESDIKQSIKYYNSKSERLGKNFIEEVDSIFERIKYNPELFPIALDKTRKAVVKRFPYNVYFVITNSKIFITAVFNTWRQPKTWKNRG